MQNSQLMAWTSHTVVGFFFPFLAAVFFPDFGGSTLDSHHGFVVEYGMDRDLDLGRCFFLFC